MFEQERVIGRLQRRIMEDPDIAACFLTGSFGRRSSDTYSDLDVVLVYPDDQTLAHAWQNRVQFAESIMPYISLKSFDAEHIRANFHIALFANGSKIDFRYEIQDLLEPNPWDSQIRILKDSASWAEAFQNKSSQLSLPQASMSLGDLTQLDQRFWVMYWDILRLLARGETDKPFPIYLELMEFTIPDLLQALPPADPARVNLLEARFSRDVEISLRHMNRLLDIYIAARTAIIERYHLQFSVAKSFEDQIQRLVEKLT